MNRRRRFKRPNPLPRGRRSPPGDAPVRPRHTLDTHDARLRLTKPLPTRAVRFTCSNKQAPEIPFPCVFPPRR